MYKRKVEEITVKTDRSSGIVIGKMGNNNTVIHTIKHKKPKGIIEKILGAIISVFGWFKN